MTNEMDMSLRGCIKMGGHQAMADVNKPTA